MDWLPLSLRPRAVLSDEQAMRRVRTHGDHTAFAQLVERWPEAFKTRIVVSVG